MRNQVVHRCSGSAVRSHCRTRPQTEAHRPSSANEGARTLLRGHRRRSRLKPGFCLENPADGRQPPLLPYGDVPGRNRVGHHRTGREVTPALIIWGHNGRRGQMRRFVCTETRDSPREQPLPPGAGTTDNWWRLSITIRRLRRHSGTDRLVCYADRTGSRPTTAGKAPGDAKGAPFPSATRTGALFQRKSATEHGFYLGHGHFT